MLDEETLPTTAEREDMGSPWLRECWYYALPGGRLAPGKMVAKTLLGEKLLIGRDASGAPFALRDICPHRGIPLSYGRFDGCEIECCYHGWRFAPDGRCTAIPSLAPGQDFDAGRIRAKSYKAREVQGSIWVFVGDGDPAAAPEIPVLPDIGERPYGMVETVVFRSAMDHSVIGLMDPAHGPFVHQAWWWRSRRSIHEKAKAFAPAPWGFAMVRHKPSRNSRAYRLLGGTPETEIVFRLPGVRFEHVRAGSHVYAALTAVTPIDQDHTEISHAIYWTMPWLDWLKPLARPYIRAFLRQDKDIMEKQSEGLVLDPALLLINDADTQAKWYYRLKNEYVRSRADRRPFLNPVKARVLKWRS